MSAREAAILVLSRVAATDAYLNLVLDTVLSERTLADPRDAALATELSYGATRRQLALDYAIQRFADRKLVTMEDRVLAALRVGAYQLFYTRVPSRAAVGETVEGLKRIGLSRASGYVNAILRKLAALPGQPLPPTEDWAEHVSVRESHPRWLVERWERQFGRERTEAMLAADNQAASVVVRANTRRTTRDALLAQLQEAGVAARPTGVSPVGIVLPSGGRVEDVLGYSEGLWQVQDEAAQLVGLYAGFPDTARVLDACAAPGGKACQQAERHTVVAVDLHANKLPKIEAEARRLGLTDRLSARAHDARTPVPAGWGRFDAALVDAPCSGLGTLRRHPELRYRRAPGDFARLAELQARILDACAQAVPPGGLLCFSVCTVEREECEQQVEAFLQRTPGWRVEAPPPDAVPGLPLDGPYLRTLPGPEGWDGFFAARLRRQ